MTLNPSRNTLPLSKHTKSIDLEHLKNTQYSLATLHQKYSRFRKNYILSQYNLNWIQFQSYSTLFENPKLDVNLEILESNLSNWISQNLFLLIWKHKQIIYIFQRLVKAINEGAYSVGKHLSRFIIQNSILLGFSKKQSVETTKQPIVWLDS